MIPPDKSIAIRIVKHEFCNNLISAFGKPIVSTSANFSGEPAPPYFSKISPKLIKMVDYVVEIDHGKIRQLKASTIIKLSKNGEYSIIRK